MKPLISILICAIYLSPFSFNLSIKKSSTKGVTIATSCSSFQLSGTILSASCRRNDGTYSQTSIDLNNKISNRNGNLVIGEGNFYSSCDSLSLSSNLNFTARCKNVNSQYLSTSINLNDYYTNENGVLLSESPNISYSGYNSTCFSSSFSNYQLTAYCNSTNGFVNTSLNLNLCIRNDNSQMIAEKNGNFGSTCSNCNLFGSSLKSTCSAMNGSSVNSSIDLNLSIANVNGSLQC